MDPARRTASVVVAALCALFNGGCHYSPVGPDTLEVHLELSSTLVALGETFTATLRLENPGDQDVEMFSAMSCLALPRVHSAEGTHRWNGTQYFCLAAEGRHVVPARGALEREFEIEPPLPYGVQPQVGWYELAMEMFVDLPDPSVAFHLIESHDGR